MADTAFKRATYQDILDLPEGVTGEIISGVLHTQPRPRIPHARASLVLGRKLSGPFDIDDDGPGGWIFLNEPELHLGDDVLVPDIAAWRRERYPDIANDAFLTVAPDWVCEVLSPSTALKDRSLKSEKYAREGVAFMWFIDPETKLLEAYKLTDGKWLQLGVFAEDSEVSVEPFDAAPFKLDSLWA